MSYAKLAVAIALLLQGLYSLITYETWWFMQNVNLIFHEAGHVFLLFFGETLYTLGGTIFEIGIPLLVAVYFWRRGEYFSTGFALWWLATALLSVSIYASDARERVLPLITDDPSTHDWFYLLAPRGWLLYDDLIGGVFYALAFVALALAAYCFWRSVPKKSFLSSFARSQK